MIKTFLFNYSKNIDKKHIYTGLQNAITGIGGFSMEEQFSEIKLNVIKNIAKYDVTDSVQLLFDVSLFNMKIGLLKNTDNTIKTTSYDNNLNKFPVDSLTIYANEFTQAINIHQLNSIGKLSNLYKDFTDYVNTFLNYEQGFS